MRNSRKSIYYSPLEPYIQFQSTVPQQGKGGYTPSGKRKLRGMPQYGPGGFTNFLSNNSGAVSGVAGLAAGLIPGDSQGASIGRGALAGFGAGMQSGNPLLGLAGLGIGAAASWIGKKKQDELQAEQEKKFAMNQKAIRLGSNIRGDQSALGLYPTEGVEDVNYYAAMGGSVSPEYLAEGGEVIVHPNDQPVADEYGGVSELSNDMSMITGDSHDAPSNGVGMEGGEFIFSKRMKATKELVSDFNDLVGGHPSDTSYAGMAAYLGKKREKMEKKLNSHDPIAINTAVEMMQRYDLALSMAADEQEYRKQQKSEA